MRKFFSQTSTGRFFYDLANSGFDRPRVFIKNQTISSLFPLFVVDDPELIDYTKTIIETKFDSDSTLLNVNKEGQYYVTKITIDRIEKVLAEILIDEDDKEKAKRILAKFNELKAIADRTTQNVYTLQQLFHNEVARALSSKESTE